MAQPETALHREAAWVPHDASVDAARVEQFVALAGELLATNADPDTLPDRLAQAIALFLGVPGAALGALEHGGYRPLARHGAAPAEHATTESAWRANAIATGRPGVLAHGDGRHTLVLPFRRDDFAGALELVLGTAEMLPDDDFHLARVLAALAGVALGNARQTRRLAHLARLKGDALAAMAHDLRAPLNALIGYTGLLAEGAFGELDDQQRGVCAALERQAVELIDLLEATLDVARLETGRLPIAVQEFALADVLDTLAGGTFARARSDGRLVVTVAADVPPLRSDRVKVKQILQNLVDNALKHGAGGAVAVEATALPDRGTVRVTVRDRGPGIEAGVLAHLFEPFRPGARQGTGFGLYLVRRLAEALGGRVAARSAAGEGTAMTVELPVRVSVGS